MRAGNWKEKRENAYCEITPEILSLKEQWEKKNFIDSRLYKEYNVKRGLRDEDGRGVLTGLTRVAEIQSYRVEKSADGERISPTEGALYYRGFDCRDLVTGSESRGRFAFEEAAYLLLLVNCLRSVSCRISAISCPPTGRCPPTSSATSL